MSWSVNYLGKASLVAKALDDESAKMSGQSKVEFDDAKPHLIALVIQNFTEDGHPDALVRLNASGHGTATSTAGTGETAEPKQLTRSCTVSLERWYSTVLV